MKNDEIPKDNTGTDREKIEQLVRDRYYICKNANITEKTKWGKRKLIQRTTETEKETETTPQNKTSQKIPHRKQT